MTGRVDAHQHYWSIAHDDYGWLQPTPALQPIYRDFGPRDLHPHLDAGGIAATVLVQAAPAEAETHRLLALAQAPGSRVGAVVGWCDLLAADAPARVRALVAHPLLKGLRPMLQDIPDPAWILDPALEPAIAAMEAADLAFDALVRPGHLAPLLAFARRHPALRVVVDHGAKPDIAAASWQPWADDIARLAAEPAVHCKLSGLVTEAGVELAGGAAGAGTGEATGRMIDETIDAALRPYVAHLLACFGPRRLIWGSDWPVVELAGGYRCWYRAATRLLAALSEADRDDVFGCNARRFYRFAPSDRTSRAGVDDQDADGGNRKADKGAGRADRRGE